MRPVFWLALLLAAGAAAQETPDVPAGPATLRGRVVHPQRPAAADGAEVVLYALPPDAPPGVRRTRAGEDGSFVFEGISNDPHTAYLVGARYAGVPYPGARVAFEAGETLREVEVRIADVTPDPSGVRTQDVRARVDWVGGRLVVSESLALENPGTQTVLAPKDGPPAAATTLPEGATDFRMPLGVVPEGMVQEGRALAYYGPVYPGPQELSYSYTLPVAPGRLELEREGVVWLVPEALARGGQEEGRYRRFMGRAVLEIPEIATGTVSVPETQIFVDRDDAAVLVREEITLETAGDQPVVGDPLLRVPLPPGARNLRFHPDIGLAPDPRGGVAVRGPVPPGATTLDLGYRLTPGEPIEKTFAAPVSLLSVFVADTGLRVESERLHRRRPVRGSDQTYIHLEGFGIEAGETVTLRLEPLPARGRTPRAARLGLLAVVALGAAAFLAAPLRGEPAPPLEPESHRERDLVIEAIRDLDHDYETGKVDEADHRQLREELRARALVLMRRERG